MFISFLLNHLLWYSSQPWSVLVNEYRPDWSPYWACSKFVRQTLHEWANCSIRTCGWARQHYDKQRLKGKGHHACVRSVAFKWIRILFRCWRDRVPYSEQRYLEALRTHGAATSKPAAIIDELTPALAGVQWESCGDFSKLAKVSS